MVFIASFLIILGLVVLLFWSITFHPDESQLEKISLCENSPILPMTSELKIMTYNVQFLAGKNYHFFYDGGPDVEPKADDVTLTTLEIANVIIDESPDIIFLQEVDSGAKRTQNRDQLKELLDHLPDEYSCATSSFYWKAKFLPHPKIWGSVGMKLAVISKYHISKSVRHQLPYISSNLIIKLFSPQRALLEVEIPLSNGKKIVVLNTHLDAFTQGTDILKRQVEFIEKKLSKLSKENIPWIIGGDFNLLPPEQYQRLSIKVQAYYSSETEISILYQKYQGVIPSLSDLNQNDYGKWLTFFPNNPEYPEPLCTLDHIFISKEFKILASYVRQEDTKKLSDHLPLITSLHYQS